MQTADRLKSLRDQTLRVASNHTINKSYQNRLKSRIEQELANKDEYIKISTFVSETESIAAAFRTILSFIDTVTSKGGVVSGIELFYNLLKIKAIHPGFSVEENKKHFSKIFDNMGGSEEAQTELKKQAWALYDLTLPYLEVLQNKKIMEEEATLRVYNEAVQNKWFKPIKKITPKGDA